MIGLGLFLYDHLARRREVPGSRAVELRKDAAGPAFARHLRQAFRYWDGWIDDSRLVILNARDAADRGALIAPRDPVTAARPTDFGWEVETGSGRRHAGRLLLNCAGPWAGEVAGGLMALTDAPRLSLVQGGHIVTRKVNRTADAWMLQQPDGRIIFVIPWENEFSLIGTTETPVSDPAAHSLTEAEEAYLLEAVNRSLAKPLSSADIVHRFAGVRPLVLEEGKDARETTRDWKLVPHEGQRAMTVVGGKITTYRLLAEAVLKRLFPESKPWTHAAPLPGGDVPRLGGTAQADFDHWLMQMKARHNLYDPGIVTRMAHLWGTGTDRMLSEGLGANMGGLFEAELQHMRDREWARTAEDALWRRTKMGLHMDVPGQAQVRAFFGA